MSLEAWRPVALPERVELRGRYVTLEPLSTDHEDGLIAAFSEDIDGKMWDWLPTGPFAGTQYRAWLDAARITNDPLHFAVRMEDGRLGGTLSLMRIDPKNGVAEVGWVTFAPRLQRTREATEAVYLLIKWAFEAGYRRFEWKCNSRNLGSRRSAERFGFSYEGIFRQAVIVKGRNRDTVWYAMIDGEWPQLRDAFETWLNAGNFDADGHQIKSLRDLTAPVLVSRDPAL